jgi:glycosyltransferase involved in cell wall biosynthesis
MRVGYLTYGLDRAPAGIGRYAIDLLRALAARPDQAEIVLLTTEREDQAGLWDAFEHHPLPGCHKLPALITAGNLALSQAIRRYRLDVVHDPNGIAPLLGPRMGARRVVTDHDAFAYVYPEAHNRLDNLRYRVMLPRALRNADAVLTDSDHSRRDIARFLAVPDDKIQVIACGVGPRFQPVPDGAARRAVLKRYGITSPYLLYVGGINARKNIAGLFEAFARLKARDVRQAADTVRRASAPVSAGDRRSPTDDSISRLKLVIAGKRQWQTGEIDATFRRLELAEHVHFTGYLADDDLPALYSAAELFVFPSLYEGFGLPPLEAMACGTPVVTSNVSSLPEVVGDAALLVDPHDVANLAATIERALADRTLWTDLRQRGLERARWFTWERAAIATIGAYQGMVAYA